MAILWYKTIEPDYIVSDDTTGPMLALHGANFISATLVCMETMRVYAIIVGFTLGIFIRSFFTIGLPYVIFGIVLAVAFLLLWHRKNTVSSVPHLLLLSLFLVSLSLGVVRMHTAIQNEYTDVYEEQLETKITEQGVVVREPDVRESSQHLYVRVADELLLVTTDRYTEVAYGDSISFSGKLTKPKPFETDLGRTFNYPGYLHARGISYVVSFAHVEVVESGKGNIVLSHLLFLKHTFMDNIEAVMTQPYVGLGEGLLLGVSQALGDDLEDAFRKTGVIHIVVLSGYNIMLVVIFVMYLLTFLVPIRFRLLFGAVSIFLFACMVGLSPTVMRASAMAFLLLLAQATERTYAVLRALMITGILMLVFNPYLLVYDVGFQFSFIATLGLILISPYLASYVTFMPTLFGLREFLTATIATQIFITPILLYQMGQFSVVAIIVNLLVLPMVPVAMLLTFLTGCIGFVSTTLSVPFAYIAYLSLLYILSIVRAFAVLPFASFTVPTFPFYIVILIYMLYGYVLWRLYVKTMMPKPPVASKTDEWTVVEEQAISLITPKNKDTDTPIFFR